jgi:hypothetical protein
MLAAAGSVKSAVDNQQDIFLALKVREFYIVTFTILNYEVERQ